MKATVRPDKAALAGPSSCAALVAAGPSPAELLLRHLERNFKFSPDASKILQMSSSCGMLFKT
eukprot:4578453-Pyramimonas_sp.AAC.1